MGPVDRQYYSRVLNLVVLNLVAVVSVYLDTTDTEFSNNAKFSMFYCRL